MLFLISTPIGNLKDITLRAIETLKECDYVLAEDTRHSRKLLNAHEIEAKLVSFHKFCEAKKEDQIIEDLKSGLKIGLISDAGTPGISDPGTRLVKRCIQEDIVVSSTPGPCAIIAALVCSGKDTDRFQFVGFLPKKSGRLERDLKEYMEHPHPTICYESAKRIHKVLKMIVSLDPNYEVVVARELTKKFEEFRRGKAKDLLGQPFKGELVIIL